MLEVRFEGRNLQLPCLDTFAGLEDEQIKRIVSWALDLDHRQLAHYELERLPEGMILRPGATVQ